MSLTSILLGCWITGLVIYTIHYYKKRGFLANPDWNCDNWFVRFFRILFSGSAMGLMLSICTILFLKLAGIKVIMDIQYFTPE